MDKAKVVRPRHARETAASHLAWSPPVRLRAWAGAGAGEPVELGPGLCGHLPYAVIGVVLLELGQRRKGGHGAELPQRLRGTGAHRGGGILERR